MRPAVVRLACKAVHLPWQCPAVLLSACLLLWHRLCVRHCTAELHEAEPSVCPSAQSTLRWVGLCSLSSVAMHGHSKGLSWAQAVHKPPPTVRHCRMRRLRQQGERQLPATKHSQVADMWARRARQLPSRAQRKRSGASWPAAALRALRGLGELVAQGQAAEGCTASVGM